MKPFAAMASNQSPCQDKQSAGHFVWHEAKFHGPGSSCDLPENQQGRVEHIFINASIYPQTFSTTASTSPAALGISSCVTTPAVTVPQPRPGAFRLPQNTGTATQMLEHRPATGVGLPHTATADFQTSVSSPGGPRTCAPSVNVTLTT